MPGRSLKNYEKYLNALKMYADAIRIKVVYKNSAEDGIYIPSRRRIEIDLDLPESFEIAILLHELGHSMDTVFAGEKIERSIDRAYKAIYKRKGTDIQNQLVMDCERRAWNYGRSIAKTTGIPLGKWYLEAEKHCLSSYKSERTK